MKTDAPEQINAHITATCSDDHPTRFLQPDEEDDTDDPIAVCPGCGTTYCVELTVEPMDD